MCAFLSEQLNYERAQKEYFQQLLMVESGIVKDQEAVMGITEFPTIHRVSTLSSIRKMAYDIAKKNEKPGNLTEAEAKFEEAISER